MELNSDGFYCFVDTIVVYCDVPGASYLEKERQARRSLNKYCPCFFHAPSVNLGGVQPT